MPPISVLIKPASNICNMSCDYCFYCDETKKREKASYGFMSEQTLKNVIRKTLLHADNMISYVYQGGEPTLCGVDFFRKVIKYQKQYNKKNIHIHNALQTNGYALNEEWCLFLKENNFLVGLSVDGTEFTHDAMRHAKTGGGTFHRILESAKLMDKHHVDYNILTVVTPLVAENISDIYSFYKKNGWPYQQYIVCLDPLEEERGRQKFSLTPEKYGAFLIKLFELWYEDYKNGVQPYIRQFENYVGLAAGIIAESCDQRGICGIQNVIEADGSVYPCDFYVLDPYYLGNLNENQMIQINEKRKEIGFIERSLNIELACKECSYYGICRGGCQRCRDYDMEKAAFSNYYCNAYRMFFDACYKRIEEIAKQIKIIP